MAEAAVSFVVERLGELLTEKASSLRSISDNVQRLQRELIWMQGFLREADAWPRRNHIVLQNIVAEVRELSHDAEDLIESHAFQAESEKEGGFAISLRRLFNYPDLASEIDEFTSRINDLGRRLQSYGSIREAGEREPQQNLQLLRRRTYSHLAEQDVIGLVDDAEKIATQLIDGTPQSLAVSICGMGGIGKTTLAKKVYRNRRVRSHFRGFAWECVSQQCKTRDVWEGILCSLTSPSGRKRRFFSYLKDHEVAEELYELLMNEKYLVVLDDIWTKEAWDCLRVGFPEGHSNTESKILLTTRNKDVALHVDPDCFIHLPRCLNESQSWELFFSVAVHHREHGFKFDKKLEEVGRKIVNRCGGLPLAIKALGGNLRTKSSLYDWTMVYNNMLSHLSGTDDGMAQLGIMSLLALSYHDLPYQLKQCFLYFGQFPEDFIVRASTIINIWVAEGVIPKGSIGEEEPMVEVEDIAYAYLEYLVSRCMVQVEKWSSTGTIKSCRLHDLMRDLCIQEAKKENFFHAKYLEDGNDEASIQSSQTRKFRRLVLYMKNSSQDVLAFRDRYAHVRSFLGFSTDTNQVKISGLQVVALARHFKYLRLLYLDGVIVCPEVPEEIGDLVHLRLLDIGSVCTKSLPSSLGKLTQLLTLKLDRVDLNLKGNDVPNFVINMHQLRHLYLPRRAFFISSGLMLNHLKNLQTLVNLPLWDVKREDLASLPSLKKLKLAATDDYEFNCLVQLFNVSTGARFNKLKSLSVSFGHWKKIAFEITKVAASCPHLQRLKLAGPLVLDLPEESQFFRQLNKLTLYYSEFAQDPMPLLGKLPNLKVLNLHSALEKDAILIPKNSFPCLHSLVISQEEHLNEWIIEEGAMPCLTFLQLYFCVNLKTLPEGLKFLDSLEELRIVDMPQSLIPLGGGLLYGLNNVIAPCFCFNSCQRIRQNLATRHGSFAFISAWDRLYKNIGKVIIEYYKTNYYIQGSSYHIHVYPT